MSDGPLLLVAWAGFEPLPPAKRACLASDAPPGRLQRALFGRLPLAGSNPAVAGTAKGPVGTGPFELVAGAGFEPATFGL